MVKAVVKLFNIEYILKKSVCQLLFLSFKCFFFSFESIQVCNIFFDESQVGVR